LFWDGAAREDVDTSTGFMEVGYTTLRNVRGCKCNEYTDTLYNPIFCTKDLDGKSICEAALSMRQEYEDDHIKSGAKISDWTASTRIR
jgi:hypothetical protein